MRSRIGLILVASVGLAATPTGELVSQTSPQARQDILNYQLSLPRADHLITAMEALTKYLVSLPDFQARVVKAMKMTPVEQRAQLEKDPKAAAILSANSLTAQEYLVGVPTLRMALRAAQGVAITPGLIVSPANLAFAKANLAQLKPKMDAADGIHPRP